MSANTAIEWTDATWNPIRGTKGRHHCVRISEGCKHCYAATMNHRFGGPDYVVGADTPRLDEEALILPLKWRKPRRIFVCSMTDLFLDEHTDAMIDRVFAVMALAPHHTFQVLTKRSKRMRRYLSRLDVTDGIVRQIFGMTAGAIVKRARALKAIMNWPLPNVELGVSAENQPRADERIPDLLETAAAVRFVSLEPLLGPIDLRAIRYRGDVDYFLDSLSARYSERAHEYGTPFFAGMAGLGPIRWVIVGGESGHGARPCAVSWIRSIKDQCREAGVPLFVKQFGRSPQIPADSIAFEGWSGKVDRLGIPRFFDSKGGDPSEWPADLRVREMPEVPR